MSPSDYQKTASKGPNKGKTRASIFDIKIKSGSPFTLVDGNVVKGKSWDKKNLILTTTKNQKIALTKIVKDVDFGGQPTTAAETGQSDKVGNKDVEVLSEAFFCYYFALELNSKLDKYSPEVWRAIKTQDDLNKWTKKVGIESVVTTQNKDKAFISRLHLAIPFLIDNSWHERLVKQIEKFFSSIKPPKSKSFEAMRADEIPSDLDSQAIFAMFAEKVKQKYGFNRPVDKDKWNPGDVWIYSDQGKLKMKTALKKIKQLASAPTPYQAGAVSELNKVVFDLYKSKDLYPVSLKAPSGKIVHISEENVVGSVVSKNVRFIKVELGATNLDVKIHFAVDLYDDIAKKVIKKDYLLGRIKSKTDTGGFRLEIEAPGAGARFGSIGTENYQWIIANTDDSGIDKLKTIRKGFKDLKEYLPPQNVGDKSWLGASKYFSEYKKDEDTMHDLRPYLDKMYKTINGSGTFDKNDPKDILNKTIASEIAIAVDQITNKLSRDVTVENLYDLSASQRFSTGIRADQLARRKGVYSKEAKALGKKEAEHVFESCFYLKIY